MRTHETIYIDRYIIPRLTERQKTKRYIPKYMMPKIMIDEAGQYPYRCPICWDKFFHKHQAVVCIDKCWEELPEQVWKRMDELSRQPKEVSSWQWDLDETHRRYCGVVLYDNGEKKYFKADSRVEFISKKELTELLHDGGFLFQKGNFDLPDSLKRFERHPKAKRENPRRSESFKKMMGVE